jgi:cytochrome c556
MVGPIDRSTPTPTDDTMVAQAPTKPNQQPAATPPDETSQPEAKPKSFDELRQAAVPVFQQLAASVGLKAPASAKPEDLINLATKIRIQLANNVSKARQSGDTDMLKVALDAEANFISALVKAGDGRLNFGIPGVTSTGQTPVAVKPPVDSNGQSVVPPVNPAVQQEVTAVLGEVKAFRDQLSKIKENELPANAAGIEQRATELLEKLKPLEQRLSDAEKGSKAMSDASAEVKKAIANLEGYIQQLQAMKNVQPTAPTTPDTVPKANGASPTPAEVAAFKKDVIPGIFKALDEGAAFFKSVQAPKNIQEAKAVMGRIAEVLPKLTESAKQLAPFAKNDPATFGKLEAGLKEQINALTKMNDMLQKEIEKAK